MGNRTSSIRRPVREGLGDVLEGGILHAYAANVDSEDDPELSDLTADPNL